MRIGEDDIVAVLRGAARSARGHAELMDLAATELNRLRIVVEDMKRGIGALHDTQAELLAALNDLLDAPEAMEWGETPHSRDQRVKARSDAEVVIARLKR